MKYKVVLKKSKEGYSISCPGLPGCWSQGRTESEALENIQSAIREYLEAVDKLAVEGGVREDEVLKGSEENRPIVCSRAYFWAGEPLE
jgi:predicted RNase H-like HicB family nuclease